MQPEIVVEPPAEPEPAVVVTDQSDSAEDQTLGRLEAKVDQVATDQRSIADALGEGLGKLAEAIGGLMATTESAAASAAVAAEEASAANEAVDRIPPDSAVSEQPPDAPKPAEELPPPANEESVAQEEKEEPKGRSYGNRRWYGNRS